MNKNVYVVLHDFTPVGDAALKYAIYLSSHVNTEIRILHLIPSKADIKNAEAKLNQIIAAADKTSNIEITPLIRVGKIFDDIGKVITEEKSQLVIMGTHGMKGFQKIFGSHAMKVITSSDIPFIVLQENTVPKELKQILVPIDLNKESLQIVNSAGDVAKMYNAKVCIAYEKQGDTMRENQMKNRIHIVKNKYEERDIKCEIVKLDSNGAYHKKITNYCNENNIDMIAIAYHTVSLLPQFEMFAQTLITNEVNIPCMIINSKAASVSYF
ncbi:MAG: universal stress protein [Flavobacteriia bacterium]|nr:universal stress protein [Flavobacteriia bacterium]